MWQQERIQANITSESSNNTHGTILAMLSLIGRKASPN